MIEGDESGYSAYVPELPAILVTGKSIDELRRRATEAIQNLVGRKRRFGFPHRRANGSRSRAAFLTCG